MTGTARFLLRLARSVAGRDRTEWIDAMAAEAESAGVESTSWAVGCFWAAVKDRIAREWRLAAAILLLPVAVSALELVLFFPVIFLGRYAGLPNWTFVAVFLIVQIPFGFLLGRSKPLRRALIAAALSSLVLDVIGVVSFWIEFGQGPQIWFEKGSQVYNVTPILGWACSLSMWLAGAWFGSRKNLATPDA
jgi:hypothetical protein